MSKPEDMELKYDKTGGVDANELCMELLIMIALELNHDRAIKLLESKGVKVGYYLD